MIRVQFSLLISHLSNLMICHHLKIHLLCIWAAHCSFGSLYLQTAKHYSDLSKVETIFSSHLLCFRTPRFVAPDPSPHHISPQRISVQPHMMQRRTPQPPHLQQPAGMPLKTYQPAANPSFQPNSLDIQGKKEESSSLMLVVCHCCLASN